MKVGLLLLRKHMTWSHFELPNSNVASKPRYIYYIRAGISFVDYVWAVVRMIVCVGLLWVGRLFGYKLVGCVSCFVRWAVWWAVGRMCGCHIIRFSLFICECCGPGAFGLF